MNKAFSLVGLLIGLVFISMGGFQIRSTYLSAQKDVSATGHMVSVSSHTGSKGGRMYAPVVEFQTPDGKTHSFESKMSSSMSPIIGTSESVLYDPAVPENALINSPFEMYIFPGFFVFGGLLIFFLFCVLPSIISSQEKQKSARLRSIGRPVKAQVTGAEPTGLIVNGVPYYKISAQWLDTASSAVHIFHSFSLNYDPTPSLQGVTEVTVYVNPSNQKDYWMDTSFLPKVVV